MIKEFDLKDAISRTASTTGCSEKEVAKIVKTFLKETETGLAEHGRVEYLGHFSISLKVRKPRQGVFRNKPWSTGERLEPEFQAFKPLRQLIEEKQGKPCV
jgi:nucleoid DNA-binding protein